MIMNSPVYSRAVRASLYYAAPSDRQLFHYAYAPHGTRETNIEFVEQAVDIHDIRQTAKAPRLEIEGASLLNHRSAVRSFYDANDLRHVGYPETAELVRSVTGAAEVIVFDHNIRRGGDPRRTAAGDIKRPVFHIHTDFTAGSAPARAAATLGQSLASGRRLAAINVWRPLAEPLRDCPLALCDASSVEARDLHETDLLYPDRTGQIYYVTFNAAHRWYYASDMRTDEAWLFKNYDSATDGRARFTPHTAFDDPTHRSAAARESIEFRTFAFFDEPAF
jgi:hypothetical protein